MAKRTSQKLHAPDLLMWGHNYKKMLVTSIFSFSFYNCKQYLFQGRLKHGIIMEKAKNKSCFCFSHVQSHCFFSHHNLTLSQTTSFRLVQTVLQTGRKHCGKRRNCSLRAISPFPAAFSKDLYCRHVKTRACLGKG